MRWRRRQRSEQAGPNSFQFVLYSDGDQPQKDLQTEGDMM